MPMRKDIVLNLLGVLESTYPNTSPTIKNLPEHNINPDELFKYIYFCWEEGFISCQPIEETSRIVEFQNIRINSKGIRFSRDF